MKWCFGLLFFVLASFSLSATQLYDQELSVSQIMITKYGIIVNIENQLLVAKQLEYIGNGTYMINENYWTCGRCGWQRDRNGKCTNRNCDGYGPRERD